jgi:hypothetical protein
MGKVEQKNISISHNMTCQLARSISSALLMRLAF